MKKNYAMFTRNWRNNYKMKALILAAGLGTRLSPLTDDKPKSLVPVNGKPIIFQQIDNLHNNSITDITVISGYKSEVLENAIHTKWSDINIIKSVEYASTNNMYSAYLGIKNMFPDGYIAPFLMMNADVFFDTSVIKALIEYEAPDAIVVDIGKYYEESMKVIEKEGKLTAISKLINKEEALGCSIDVYKFSSDGGNSFFNHCVDYIEKRKELKLWSEVALNDALSDIIFKPCPLKGRWLEIDNHDDLAAAEELFI